MSVLVRYQPENLTREQYDEVSRRIQGMVSWPPEGCELHVMFGDEGSMRVSEIWSSEEQWRAFGERLMPVLDEVGVKHVGEPELFQVHEFQGAALAAAQSS